MATTKKKKSTAKRKADPATKVAVLIKILNADVVDVAKTFGYLGEDIIEAGIFVDSYFRSLITTKVKDLRRSRKIQAVNEKVMAYQDQLISAIPEEPDPVLE